MLLTTELFARAQRDGVARSETTTIPLSTSVLGTVWAVNQAGIGDETFQQRGTYCVGNIRLGDRPDRRGRNAVTAITDR